MKPAQGTPPDAHPNESLTLKALERNQPRGSQLVWMESSAKFIGENLRRIFAAVTRRPLQWSQIDALATLEEQEEAQRRDQGQKLPERDDAQKKR